jgi:spermidine/putrescine transport system permease protein
MTGRRLTPYALISPAVLAVIVSIGACLTILFVLSFATQKYLTIDYSWTMANYQQALSSAVVHKLMIRSAIIAVIVTLLSLLLAYPIAYGIAFDLTENKLLWLVLFTLPCWISYLLRILSWKLILGHNGVINGSLLAFGAIDEPLSFLVYNPVSVVIALVHAWAPFAILPIYVSLEKIDRSLIQASGDLGEPPLHTFMRVTLPLSMPGVIAAGILIFVPTFGEYVTPQLIGGPSGAMIGNFIATQFGASNNWPLGATISLLAMATATFIVCLVLIGPRALRRGLGRR